MAKYPDATILNIDLTKQKIWTEILPGKVYKLYPGGSALGTYLTMKRLDIGVDPLSEGNVLVFSTSALTGFAVAGLSRVCVTTKSPLTGTIADSQAGGFFPAHLRNNGYDAVVLHGKAEKPVYIYIDGDDVSIRDASNVWGKVTGDAEAQIKKELGSDQIEIAQIGPAGENLVKFACILNKMCRANGRNGVGAVMGSKNLKAVVVHKAKTRKPYDEEGLKALTKEVAKRLADNEVLPSLGEHGTDLELEGTNEDGFLATYNFRSGWFGEKANNITGKTMTKTILKGRDTCFACPVRCKRVVEIEGKVDPMYGGPEYETCGTFGSFCGVDNLEAIAIANQYCNMYGLDTISCGATISFAMECFEQGVINETDTDGMSLEFGKGEIFSELIEKIAYRKGFGNILAEGSYRAAELIGGDAMKYCVTVKKQELPAHMPQYKPMLGLIYAVGNFGADHQSNEHDPSICAPEDSIDCKRLNMIGVNEIYEDQFDMMKEK